MHCGCPLPGATVGQRLSRLIQRGNHVQADSALHSTVAAATHPSDHNGVYVPGTTTDTALAEHGAKLAKRRERDLKLVEKGKMAREDYERGGAHGAAFLYPVPIWFGTAGCAVGAGGVGISGFAGCTAVRCSLLKGARHILTKHDRLGALPVLVEDSLVAQEAVAEALVDVEAEAADVVEGVVDVAVEEEEEGRRVLKPACYFQISVYQR